MAPRVFFLEQLRRDLDFETARKFGGFELILPPEEKRCSAFNVNKYSALILQKLIAHRFDPQVDCLCLAGSVVPLSVVIAAMLGKWPTIRVLFFSAAEEHYVLRKLGEITRCQKSKALTKK